MAEKYSRWVELRKRDSQLADPIVKTPNTKSRVSKSEAKSWAKVSHWVDKDFWLDDCCNPLIRCL